MKDDFAQAVGEALNGQLAEIRAHQTVLLVLTGQLVGMAPNWRERLEVMRANAEVAVERHQFDAESSGSSEGMRLRMQELILQHFDEVRAALVDWEKRQRPVR